MIKLESHPLKKIENKNALMIVIPSDVFNYGN
jgi:hypothetical protein